VVLDTDEWGSLLRQWEQSARAMFIRDTFYLARICETNEIVILFIVNAGLVSRIADSLQEGCLSGVGPTDDKNAESSVLLCGV
jgi:hypothetical protein